MKTLGASEAKNRFGELLDLARREPSNSKFKMVTSNT